MNDKVETINIAWMAAGGMQTYTGLGRGAAAHVIFFSSNHTNGVNFCFADGSVHTLKHDTTKWNGKANGNSPDWLTLQQLAGWKDGASLLSNSLVD